MDIQQALTHIQERNQQIGKHIIQARENQHRTITECAALLGTSRRRYRAIEQGEVGISVPELEVLAGFLNLSAYEVSTQALDLGLVSSGNGNENLPLIVRGKPGQKVHLVFELQN